MSRGTSAAQLSLRAADLQLVDAVLPSDDEDFQSDEELQSPTSQVPLNPEAGLRRAHFGRTVARARAKPKRAAPQYERVLLSVACLFVLGPVLIVAARFLLPSTLQLGGAIAQQHRDGEHHAHAADSFYPRRPAAKAAVHPRDYIEAELQQNALQEANNERAKH